ncbi:phenoloxidase-activating enzyme-like [Aricia agestis]|uniref:phenoloxidase-activating enzyme-like n=1 Tax=Aricia agestis TaxID=91739 RepID=UPI001C202D2F|nr:phenoloxidase-activating enzyme-like [Aricia agestis]
MTVAISSVQVIISFLLIHSAQGQSSCITPSNANGECIPIRQCKQLLDLLLSPSRTAEDVAYIKNSQCGFRDNNPLVCCPKAQSNGCTTPDGRQGNCIDLYSCPAITSLLTPPVPRDTFTFIQNSKCNGPSAYSVCCGATSGGGCQPSWSTPDPSTRCCGLDPSSGNRIYGGNATAVDQYPWLVIIEYMGRDNKIKLLCGGSLISSKYVLTAGHCVKGPVLNIGNPINARVGDYDITKSGPDCVEVEGGSEDCSDGEQVIPIEETIPHELYDPKSALRRNDIALIRLKIMVPYTDFIRPICLPSSDITLGPDGRSLITAGWGAVDEFSSSSAIKLQVVLPLVKVPACQPAYNASNRRVTLWEGQLCAGGEKGKDSCKGDSGGPLMYDDGTLYYIDGVVSFGPTPCGIENVPGVYTKVFYYLPWIRSKMRP